MNKTSPLINELHIGFRRCFNRYSFLCCICIALLMWFERMPSVSLVEWVLNISTSSLFVSASLLVSSIPGVTMFGSEIESGYSSQIVFRSSYKKYVISKIIVAFFSAMVIWMVGFCISLVIKILLMHGDWGHFISDYSSYVFALRSNMYILFSFLVAMQVGLFAGMIACIGIACESITKNRSLSLVLPVIIVKLEDLVLSVLVGESSPQYAAASLYMVWIGSIKYNILTNSWSIRLLWLLLVVVVVTEIAHFNLVKGR